MNRRRLIIIGVIIIVIILAVVIYFLQQKAANDRDNNPTKSVVPQGETVVPNGNANGQASAGTSQTVVATTPPTTEDYYNAIVQSGGIAADADGQVSFGIGAVKQPLAGWYVVTVLKNGTEPNFVIFQQTGNPSSPLHIVAGPGTDFPPQYISLPDAVRKALK